ncbi:hypothetical protein CFBP3846_P300064 (plasmid) [Pseudomonas syringae pv. avii]|uniref:Secreted protein n=1 Tax=Pseudomonas syringae pv. avii TaxID=663959 RepID=A0ABY1UGR7_PSESX|nr:hypothetical protein CFBP3846_P300064 [Pseudomonas syringae pv. avii]
MGLMTKLKSMFLLLRDRKNGRFAAAGCPVHCYPKVNFNILPERENISAQTGNCRLVRLH